MRFGGAISALILIPALLRAESGATPAITVRGLTGTVSDVVISVPAAERIAPLAASEPHADIDLRRMAVWAMNYLVETPRPEFGYEPVFQCRPLQCPPIPAGHDPVVACDTDARMDWEWYYMREISGSTAGGNVEAAFHRRIRDYIDPDGIVWASPGAFNEGKIHAVYGKKDLVIHIWGATKILKSLSEDYIRTGDPESRELARKVMLALKKLALWDKEGRCWFACGMGALRADRTPVPNGWNPQPAPLVESLVTYWRATSDPEGLRFARAFAEGMIHNVQPNGIRFVLNDKGEVERITGGFVFGPHSHATMHAVWGIADLGVATDDRRYVDFAKGVFNWLLARGTGTGWFPAGPDNCDETCCISDMMSLAGLLGRAGYSEYFDYLERYLRNYISPLQFVVTPEFEASYRERNRAAGTAQVEQGLRDLRRFQGGIIGGSGLNDYENDLLGKVGGFRMYGCCAPEGMRAIYTSWINAIARRPASRLGPAGVYVNLSLGRDSPWGRVVSYYPQSGRLTVKVAVRDSFFLRPPHWAPRDQVRAFTGTQPVPVAWSGDFVRFDHVRPGDELTITYPLVRFTHDVDGLWAKAAPKLHLTFHWLGNMVTSSEPAGGPTPLFHGKPRLLPSAIP